MRTQLLLTAAIAASSISVAQAGNLFKDADPYVTASVGASWLSDAEADGTLGDDVAIVGGPLDGTTFASGSRIDLEAEYDADVTYALAAGIDKGLYRLELEVAFSESEVDSLDDFAIGTTPSTLSLDNADGEIQTTYIFANAYYDIPVQWNRIEPYVGAGIGIGFVDADYEVDGFTLADDDDTQFAYQFLAGATVPFTEKHAAFAEVGYRATTDVEIDLDFAEGDIEIENGGVIAEIGYRYNFGG